MTTPLPEQGGFNERWAPVDWLLDDLLTTIDDAAPEELPSLHAKLTAFVSALKGREDEWHPKYRKQHELELLDRVEEAYDPYDPNFYEAIERVRKEVKS